MDGLRDPLEAFRTAPGRFRQIVLWCAVAAVAATGLLLAVDAGGLRRRPDVAATLTVAVAFYAGSLTIACIGWMRYWFKAKDIASRP